MVQKLSAAGHPLLSYRKHQGVKLTKAGTKAALKVIRHHRLLETYLVTNLGYSWDEVHAEAIRLQHAVSEKLAARMEAALGYPNRDPHGELIPQADLSISEDHSVSLLTLRPPQACSIFRIHDPDPQLLVYLEEYQLMPGADISVQDYSPLDQTMTLLVEGQKKNIVIGPAISCKIFVEESFSSNQNKGQIP
jgi:DtxR family Mn-dependent transcriptional regulator